ncbi:MAG: efflux RND transporter periplasmic adaptor subunit [Mizugakiibacter sp.]|uniref:efflux RND transporter periplasmic adaptor subunit n=1 Tax=Mizugakiibacter sp. TaxID=1972610 RepID=UPI0031C1DFE4|nr:efflux RND transporter periplasmic adaptor subunit [Xanthomonadaceae bacterium]
MRDGNRADIADGHASIIAEGRDGSGRAARAPMNVGAPARKWVVAVVLLGLLALALGAGAWLWRRDRAGTHVYRTAQAGYADIEQTISANGTLNPVTLVNVGTQVSGTVRRLYADYNDRVQAGQVLLELDPSIYRAQLEQSEGNLANARASLALAVANEARARAVFQKSYLSRQDYQQVLQTLHAAQAQVRTAQGQVDLSRTNLGYTVIRSPVAGVVVERAVDVGQTVAASFQTPTLFRIAQDLKDMQIDSSFAEADIGRIRAGQPVRFSVDAFPDREFAAQVRQVRLNPTTLQNVVTYDVVIGVSNPEEILMPGMTAYVNVIVARRAHVLAVPLAALRFVPQAVADAQAESAQVGQGGAAVYVVADESLRRVPVAVGISNGTLAEVDGGALRAGDRVVVGEVQAAGRAGPATSTIRLRVF